MANRVDGGAPKNAKGWLALVAFCAGAGAILGFPGRGPIKDDDRAWTHWAGIVAEWAVMGAFIGLVTRRMTHQAAPAFRFAALYAITMPVLMLAIEGIRFLAVEYTGGWTTGVTSAAFGAIAGAAMTFPLVGLSIGVGKLLGLAWPPPTTH